MISSAQMVHHLGEKRLRINPDSHLSALLTGRSYAVALQGWIDAVSTPTIP
ncbi:MAG: hypothetical protein ACJ797_11305 [Ktedonobacteraceae bacterium]